MKKIMHNTVTIVGSNKEVNKIVKDIESSYGVFDFGKIIGVDIACTNADDIIDLWYFCKKEGIKVKAEQTKMNHKSGMYRHTLKDEFIENIILAKLKNSTEDQTKEMYNTGKDMYRDTMIYWYGKPIDVVFNSMNATRRVTKTIYNGESCAVYEFDTEWEPHMILECLTHTYPGVGVHGKIAGSDEPEGRFSIRLIKS